MIDCWSSLPLPVPLALCATSCRSTFRRISQDTKQFVNFANGLMNETNNLIASVMKDLPEVKRIQLLQKDATAWGALGEEQQKEVRLVVLYLTTGYDSRALRAKYLQAE